MADVITKILTNKIVYSGTNVIRFNLGEAIYQFSEFGLTSRPAAIFLTPQSANVIMQYNWDGSENEIKLNAYRHDGVGFDGGIRFGMCIIE